LLGGNGGLLGCTIGNLKYPRGFCNLGGYELLPFLFDG